MSESESSMISIYPPDGEVQTIREMQKSWLVGWFSKGGKYCSGSISPDVQKVICNDLPSGNLLVGGAVLPEAAGYVITGYFRAPFSVLKVVGSSKISLDISSEPEGGARGTFFSLLVPYGESVVGVTVDAEVPGQGFQDSRPVPFPGPSLSPGEG